MRREYLWLAIALIGLICVVKERIDFNRLSSENKEGKEKRIKIFKTANNRNILFYSLLTLLFLLALLDIL
ncbi:MAG: hypothetical protein HUJ97_02365 [Bacteroidales bacterium]|nr:hypothetical protein [Bacteroidales bacterium]